MTKAKKARRSPATQPGLAGLHQPPRRFTSILLSILFPTSISISPGQLRSVSHSGRSSTFSPPRTTQSHHCHKPVSANRYLYPGPTHQIRKRDSTPGQALTTLHYTAPIREPNREGKPIA
ncbi:hypothetical protein BJY04DRAFT_127405 [Aspergillus karnatakaensis]|uniref:uncharacterized protein n=1 Tax=Aspergillus karnatakaensis TaxID=1810916 RepID=UPI003CCD6C73